MCLELYVGWLLKDDLALNELVYTYAGTIASGYLLLS